MPEMGGFEVAKHLRLISNDIKIIALSASVNEQTRKDAHDSGCNDFLRKPVIKAELLDCLEKHLEINWKYKNEEQIKMELDIPPKETLKKLVELAKSGDLTGIQKELKEISSIDPKYFNFTIELEKYVDDFDFENFIKKIQKFLKAE